jgi:eukaryotic-like serine/threonine-protein kinase
LTHPEASGPTDPEPASPIGRIILGRFRIERILGHGGMGEVLLAHDTLLNRRVALKRMHARNAEGTESEGRRNAILKEARRASQVSDRRIAAIYDVLELESDVLIVMEYVDGTTLRARMTEPLPVSEFWDLAAECVGAVGAAHAHGVIHRDIKPENLMLTNDGQVKILDFGIARRAESPEGVAATTATTLTTTGRSIEVAGTPQYMAPEAHYGGRIDERTDIFSLGTVFYELLTARSPFAGPTYEVVLERVMNSTPAPASEVNRAVSPGLAAVIARMMAKDPGQRPASCGELMRELTETRSLETGKRAASRASAAAQRRAWLRPALVAVAAVAALGIAWAAWRGVFGTAVPADRNLAVLPPQTPGASEDFASFALGATELLASRLQRHQDRAGFQLASFSDAFDAKLTAPDETRRLLGVNLALRTEMHERSDALEARLELWDTVSGRMIASRTVQAPIVQPFSFLDRTYTEAARMLRLKPRGPDAVSASGVRGAGTLHYLLQGTGRSRSATTVEQGLKAADELELACRTEPDAAAPHARLANAQWKLYALGRDRAWLDRAEASLRDAVARDSSRAYSHLYLGIVLEAKGDVPGGLDEFRRAWEILPTDDVAAQRLGRAYGLSKRPDQEKQTYLAAIAQRPHCWKPHWWLAVWEYRHGHIEESIRAYREMIRRAPRYNTGYSSLGGLLVLRGDYGPAIDTLKLSIVLRPDRVAFANLGTAYFNSGRLEQAIDAYNQALQFGFADPFLWSNLGDAYYWLRGRHDQAMEAYAQAVQMGRQAMADRSQPGRRFDVSIPASMAGVFPKLAQPDSARYYLQVALRADSTNTMVQCGAALSLWQLGERGRAIGWLQKAVQGGYPLAWLRDSPVFQEWRGEAAFRAIIAGAGPQSQSSTSPRKGGRT